MCRQGTNSQHRELIERALQTTLTENKDYERYSIVDDGINNTLVVAFEVVNLGNVGDSKFTTADRIYKNKHLVTKKVLSPGRL